MARSRATLQPDWASADLRRRINGGECTRSRGIPDTRPHRASPNLGPFGGAIPFIPHKDVGFYRCVRKGCANGCYVLLRPQVLHAGFHGLAIERPPMRGRSAACIVLVTLMSRRVFTRRYRSFIDRLRAINRHGRGSRRSRCRHALLDLVFQGRDRPDTYGLRFQKAVFSGIAAAPCSRRLLRSGRTGAVRHFVGQEGKPGKPSCLPCRRARLTRPAAQMECGDKDEVQAPPA